MPQSVQKLQERVQEMTRIFGLFLNNPAAWALLEDAKKKQLTTGLNNAYGQTVAALHEIEQTMLSQKNGRNVITQKHGDITVGLQNEIFAKTIECKSITSAGKNAVDAQLDTALQQLAGSTNHNPRPEDVRIVDIRIDGNNNPWPFTGGKYGIARPRPTLADLVSEAEKVVTERIKGQGFSPHINWVMAQPQVGVATALGMVKDVNGQRPFPHSSRPVVPTPHGPIKVRCLTVKVRYVVPYRLVDTPLGAQQNRVQALKELVIQMYQQQGQLEIKATKAVVSEFESLVTLTPIPGRFAFAVQEQRSNERSARVDTDLNSID